MKKGMRKRILSLMLAVVLVLSALPVTASAASSFTDTSGHWAEETIERWKDSGVVKGRKDGRFSPDDPITRAEFAVILNRLFAYTEQSTQQFTDVAADAWYAEAVSKCVAAGVLKGSGSEMRPNDPASRQEAVVILARAFGLSDGTSGTEKFSDASEIGTWALPEVNAMAAAGYVNGSHGKFYPNRNITRAELLTVLDNMVSSYDTWYYPSGHTAKAATGTYVGKESENGLVKYSNITYATAERWQAPQAVAKSDETIAADADTTTLTVQKNADGIAQDENTLTLDIYTSTQSTNAKKGVLVWNTCGGGTGSNSNKFNPTKLVEEHPDLIVVVVNIRVSYFGCIDLSVFPDYEANKDTYQYSNNLMRLDYLEALKWIHKNIAGFGGDPSNVTLGGQSAGAANASTMLLMEEAHPYFSKVIMESGVAIDRISLATMDESRNAAEIFKTATGVSTLEEALKLDPQKLLDAQTELTKNCIGAYLPDSQSKTFTSVIDDVVIPSDYWSAIEKAAEGGIKILVGSTNGEYDRDLAGKTAEEALEAVVSANWGKLDPDRGGASNAQKIIQGYVKRGTRTGTEYERDTVTAYKDLKNDINQKASAVLIAEAFSKKSTAYLFSYEWYAANDQGNRATHGSEKNALYPAGADTVPEDLAKAMRSAWASFALCGDPNQGNTQFSSAKVEWKPYSAGNKWTMAFDTDMKCVAGQRVEDLESLLPLFAEYHFVRSAA